MERAKLHGLKEGVPVRKDEIPAIEHARFKEIASTEPRHTPARLFRLFNLLLFAAMLAFKYVRTIRHCQYHTVDYSGDVPATVHFGVARQTRG